MYMKNNIILFAVATLALNSCGIYKKYEPVATLPENLYREEIAPADTFSIGNISWRDLFTDPALQSADLYYWLIPVRSRIARPDR